MAAWRRAIELSLGDEDSANLRSIAQSRTEPASRVERARILLAYREDPSFFAVGRRLGLHHQTVQRCVERAVAEGPIAALDDRPRPGREPTITLEAKAWLVWLACRKAKDFGYPHELWTTRLLASHVREYGPAQGHACLANLAGHGVQDPRPGRGPDAATMKAFSFPLVALAIAVPPLFASPIEHVDHSTMEHALGRALSLPKDYDPRGLPRHRPPGPIHRTGMCHWRNLPSVLMQC